MAVNISIYPGSSSFFPGKTPFGWFDNDYDFQVDADSVTKWSALRLGYPLVDIELQDIEPLLAEWNYGDYEGLTSDAIRKQNPQWTIFKEGAPQGESPQAIQERTLQLLAYLRTISGNIALFSHGHFLRALAATWLQLPVEKGSLFSLAPGSISTLGFEREQPVILLWNEL